MITIVVVTSFSVNNVGFEFGRRRKTPQIPAMEWTVQSLLYCTFVAIGAGDETGSGGDNYPFIPMSLGRHKSHLT